MKEVNNKESKRNNDLNNPIIEEIVAGINITSPNRMLYVEQGINKIELARYYEMISDHMVPYVRNLPLSFIRCPMGRE